MKKTTTSSDHSQGDLQNDGAVGEARRGSAIFEAVVFLFQSSFWFIVFLTFFSVLLFSPGSLRSFRYMGF